jgi:hypothetical protein
MDARELCVRLARYLDGYKDELRPIRIPSRAETPLSMLAMRALQLRRKRNCNASAFTLKSRKQNAWRRALDSPGVELLAWF